MVAVVVVGVDVVVDVVVGAVADVVDVVVVDAVAVEVVDVVVVAEVVGDAEHLRAGWQFDALPISTALSDPSDAIKQAAATDLRRTIRVRGMKPPEARVTWAGVDAPFGFVRVGELRLPISEVGYVWSRQPVRLQRRAVACLSTGPGELKHCG
jgi:hypothetical protein